MEKLYKIALLEDHPLTCIGVKQALAPMHQIALEAATGVQLLGNLEANAIDLILIDFLLSSDSPIEMAKRIKAEHPEVKILVFSLTDNEDVHRQLLDIGVEGLLRREANSTTLFAAVRAVLQGQRILPEDTERLEHSHPRLAGTEKPAEALTERETEVLCGFCKGMTSFEIANALCISQRTVENHKQHIFRKCGINNTVEMMIYALKSGIVSL